MEQEILSGLMARGIPEHIAKGIVANMIAESSLNPGINEASPLVAGSRGGYGLNQWTGPRRRQFEAYAADRGSDPADVNTQLDFTLWELQNTERNAWDKLSSTQNAVEAARVYSDAFLRPGIPHMDRRLSEAERLAGVNALAAAPQPQAPQQNALAMMPQFKAIQLDPNAFMANKLRRA